MPGNVKPYPETHQTGIVSVENMPDELDSDPGHMKCDFGIQIAADGRVWICINGQAFIRFSPHKDGKMTIDKCTNCKENENCNMKGTGLEPYEYCYLPMVK